MGFSQKDREREKIKAEAIYVRIYTHTYISNGKLFGNRIKIQHRAEHKTRRENGLSAGVLQSKSSSSSLLLSRDSTANILSSNSLKEKKKKPWALFT
jgi:predicted secreted acid phosphatase